MFTLQVGLAVEAREQIVDAEGFQDALITSPQHPLVRYAKQFVSQCFQQFFSVGLLYFDSSLRVQNHWETKGRFRKRVVLANAPSFRFCSFRGNIRRYPRSDFRSVGTIQMYPRSGFRSGGTSGKPPFWKPFWKPPFWKPPFCQPQSVSSSSSQLGFCFVFRSIRASEPKKRKH